MRPVALALLLALAPATAAAQRVNRGLSIAGSRPFTGGTVTSDIVMSGSKICIDTSSDSGGDDCIRVDSNAWTLGVGGSTKLYVDTAGVQTVTGNSWYLEHSASSATNPTVIHDAGCLTCGLGGATNDTALLTGGVSRLTAHSTGDVSVLLGTVTHTDVITFCGQGPNGATAVYLSPRNTGLLGDATCDAEDNTTEGTADEIWAPYAFRAVSMVCGINDVAVDATGVTFSFRDDTADASSDLSCVTGATDASGFASCADMDTTPPTVAAGSAIAMKAIAATGNFTTGDIWCRLTITN
jgi:hypothetical protein